MRIALAHAHVFRFARGIERYIVALSGALVRAGIDTTIVTLRQPSSSSPLRYPDLDARVRVHTLAHPRYYGSIATIPFYAADFARGGYDHILIQFGLNGEGLAARLIAALSRGRTRYSIVFHFPYEASPGRFLEFKHYGLLDHATHHIAVSAYIAASVRARLGVSCTVIPLGVDPEHFRPDAALRAATRRSLGIAPDERVVITVGALEPRKGMGRLLAALASPTSAAPADRIIIVGEGPEAATLRAQVERDGLDARVIWITRASDMSALYNAADVFALLSEHEAFGLAALEAMACARPVVVSAGSAFPEFVAPGTGLLVEPANPAAVRDALAGLLSDPARRGAMGRVARRHVEDGYGWDRVAERLLALLQSDQHAHDGGTPPASRPESRAWARQDTTGGLAPRLSVLLATVNRAALLDRTLYHLLHGGDERPDEIVVVNGGRDGTAEVVARYHASGANVRLVDVPNTGLSNARNAGYPQCGGEIVATLDDDVIVAADWARRIKAAHIAYPHAGGIGGRTLNEFPHALVARFEQARAFDVRADGTDGADGARPVRTVAGVNMSYKRVVMEEVGLFDTALTSGEDVDYNWRVARAGYPILYDPSIVLTHHNRTRVRPMLRQQFWYGRGYFGTRRKWPDLPSQPPRGLRGWKNWVKTLLFVVDPCYQGLLLARRAATPGDRVPFAALAVVADLIWKAGFLYEALRARRR